jgi:hypothetical protein
MNPPLQDSASISIAENQMEPFFSLMSRPWA